MEKDEFTQILGERIKEIRLEVQISQEELAKRCLKDKQHIQLIESGKVTPNIYNTYLISKALGTTIDSLLQDIYSKKG